MPTRGTGKLPLPRHRWWMYSTQAVGSPTLQSTRRGGGQNSGPCAQREAGRAGFEPAKPDGLYPCTPNRQSSVYCLWSLEQLVCPLISSGVRLARVIKKALDEVVARAFPCQPLTGGRQGPAPRLSQRGPGGSRTCLAMYSKPAVERVLANRRSCDQRRYDALPLSYSAAFLPVAWRDSNPQPSASEACTPNRQSVCVLNRGDEGLARDSPQGNRTRFMPCRHACSPARSWTPRRQSPRYLQESNEGFAEKRFFSAVRVSDLRSLIVD